MNEIIFSANTGNSNRQWGPEYIIMNGKNFIENNADAIIEMMVKIKLSYITAQHGQ